MRKQTKIAAGISAAALVAVAGAMTSLAATGWVNEGGSWYYYNTSGDYVTDTWKAYNGQYFYLGDDGEMWTSRLVEDGDNHYYVDANGAMVKNTWVAVPADDDDEYDVDYRWYYFGSTGKAYRKSYGKTINGKKYGFDEDGKMLFGFVADGGYDIKDDEDEPILDADYYFGTNEDGARHSGWLQYTDALTDKDEDYYWFYFNTSNGKKVSDQMKTINGKKYNFDEDGIMSFKWDEATVGGKEVTTWFGTLEDGSLAKNKWIWNKPYEDVTIQSNIDDYNDETPRWFRTDASGNLVKGVTKKINSKWYVFDDDGVMLTGLVVLAPHDEDVDVTNGSVSGADFYFQYDMDEVDKDDIVYGCDIKLDDGTTEENFVPHKALHYFSEDEEKDGSMKTGTMKIELADDEYTFCFTKNTGAAKDGYDSSSKKVYNSGILEKAGDDKYKVVTDLTSDVDYLVGSTGSVVKSVSTYKDANDKYYVYLVGKTGDEHNWYIGSTYSEDDAKGVKNNKDSYVLGDGVITASDTKGSYEIQLVGIGTEKTSTTD